MKLLFFTRLLLLLLLVVASANSSSSSSENDGPVSSSSSSDLPIMTIGLVADNHYDTFPAGEKAPWQPMNSWLQGQAQRTTTPLKRRYDLARDKMLESVDVFNRLATPSDELHTQLTFTVNLGDLINNDLMWNLKPILDAFNSVKSPKYSIVGNHDRRAHNDRFGKNNKTQEDWLMNKLGVKEWFYSVDYPPFMNVFLDSMVMEEPESNPKRRQQLKWLRSTLERAKELGRVVIIFGHISIGLQTSPFAPVLKDYHAHIVGGFFGHHHKGGYILQDKQFHTTIIQGQIETMTNAFAVLEVFDDRMELTGFGRVPTRVMKFYNPATVEMIRKFVKEENQKKNNKKKNNKRREEKRILEIGGEHQPAASPEELWPREEVLQKPPPLNLNIRSYRKPLVPIAEPNGGSTRFLKKVYSRWPRRVKTLAPEDPVDLSSLLQSSSKNNNNNNNNKQKSSSAWYRIDEKGVEHHDNNNNNNQQKQEDSHHHSIPTLRPELRTTKRGRKRSAKTQDEEEDTTRFSSSSSSSSSVSNLWSMFDVIEVFLVVTCFVVVFVVLWRYRRVFFSQK